MDYFTADFYQFVRNEFEGLLGCCHFTVKRYFRNLHPLHWLVNGVVKSQAVHIDFQNGDTCSGGAIGGTVGDSSPQIPKVGRKL